jgi:hypothetical protein
MSSNGGLESHLYLANLEPKPGNAKDYDTLLFPPEELALQVTAVRENLSDISGGFNTSHRTGTSDQFCDSISLLRFSFAQPEMF